MINPFSYTATAMALVRVLIFDETFSTNLFQAVGEPIAIMPLWELEVAGILDVLNARCVMLRLSFQLGFVNQRGAEFSASSVWSMLAAPCSGSPIRSC